MGIMQDYKAPQWGAVNLYTASLGDNPRRLASSCLSWARLSSFFPSLSLQNTCGQSSHLASCLGHWLVYIICGILYILTEYNPTKKKVTISLALSIVTILGTFWSVMHSLPSVVHNYRHYSYFAEDNDTDIEEAQWASYYEAMGVTVESIFLFYSFVGGIIFIVMSALAGAALRSTKNQAIVVMTASPNETPVE
ncbi:uncharacterized protein LOC119890340 isoform X2 [Micropterus salmoides]|uniref:uncharacterized protein LOC119890340 isoform X2 n=1 Tax=Micropterus salmoides TaxID=27706 RepID=UPI0018ECD6FD|nr:uncharacterized protein LOC119890340 isoform X2 [Micropterus salmoides]